MPCAIPALLLPELGNNSAGMAHGTYIMFPSTHMSCDTHIHPCPPPHPLPIVGVAAQLSMILVNIELTLNVWWRQPEMQIYDNVDNVLVNILKSVRALVAAFYNSRNI